MFISQRKILRMEQRKPDHKADVSGVDLSTKTFMTTHGGVSSFGWPGAQSLYSTSRSRPAFSFHTKSDSVSSRLRCPAVQTRTRIGRASILSAQHVDFHKGKMKRKGKRTCIAPMVSASTTKR